MTAVAATHGRLYIADSDSRHLHVLEVTENGTVEARAVLDWGATPGVDALSPAVHAMEVEGDHLYLLAVSTQHTVFDPGVKAMLLVVDLTHPSTPRIAASLALAEMAFDLEVLGPWIYVGGISRDMEAGTYQQDLIVIDARTPAAPRRHGSVPIELWPIDMQIEDGRLYLAGVDPFEHSVLQVVDLDPPDTPQPRGFLTRISGTHNVAGFDSLAVRHERAFVVEDWQVFAVDVSNPEEPSWLASLQGDFLHMTPLELDWFGDSLMVVSADALHLLDPELPPGIVGAGSVHRPDILGSVGLPMREATKEFLDDLALYDRFAFVSDYSGVTVVDLMEPTDPRVVGRFARP